MKEIVFIADHADSLERMDNLLDLIKKIKSTGREILLSSHLWIPEYIASRCDYFIFSSDNELIEIPSIIGEKNSRSYSCIVNGMKFYSPEFGRSSEKGDHRYSALKQVIIGLNYLRHLSYEVVHFVEGDSSSDDLSEIEENYKIISSSEYDAVCYKSNTMMAGSFFSLNLNLVDFNGVLPLKKIDIVEKLRGLEFCERFLREFFLENLRFLEKKFDLDLYPILRGCSKREFKNPWVSFFDIRGEWKYLIWNPSESPCRIEIYNSIVKEFRDFIIEKNHWVILPIGKIQREEDFRVYIDGFLFKNYKLDPAMSQFKNNRIEFI